MALKDWFEPRQLPQDFLFNWAFEAARKAIMGWAEKHGPERIQHLLPSFEICRAELMALFHDLANRDLPASQNLLRRQRERQYLAARSYGGGNYQPGDENEMITALSILYRAFENKPGRLEQILVDIGQQSDEDFDAGIQILIDDRLRQWLARAATGLSEINNDVRTWLNNRRRTKGRRAI